MSHSTSVEHPKYEWTTQYSRNWLPGASGDLTVPYLPRGRTWLCWTNLILSRQSNSVLSLVSLDDENNLSQWILRPFRNILDLWVRISGKRPNPGSSGCCVNLPLSFLSLLKKGNALEDLKCVMGSILSVALLGSDDTYKKCPRNMSSSHIGMPLKGWRESSLFLCRVCSLAMWWAIQLCHTLVIKQSHRTNESAWTLQNCEPK